MAAAEPQDPHEPHQPHQFHQFGDGRPQASQTAPKKPLVSVRQSSVSASRLSVEELGQGRGHLCPSTTSRPALEADCSVGRSGSWRRRIRVQPGVSASRRLWNPLNYIPPEPPRRRSSLQRRSQCLAESGGQPEGRELHPLLSLPERRRSRGGGDIELPARTASRLSRRDRAPRAPMGEWADDAAAATEGVRQDGERSPAASPPEDGVQRQAEAGLRMPDQDDGRDVELGLKDHSASGATGAMTAHQDRSQTSLRVDGAPASLLSFNSSRADVAGAQPQDPQQPEDVDEYAWGPSHPCFPHPNPHVPLHSPQASSTRIIRVKRDWMIAGDQAPTFSNLYPEILDPLLPEEQFRLVIRRLNDELTRAFNPRGWHNLLDAALGLLTFWLWDDLGLTAVKRRLAAVEAWLEQWNREHGDKEGVRIVPLRRTAYMTLDIEIPDPHIGSTTSSELNSRPPTGAEAAAAAGAVAAEAEAEAGAAPTHDTRPPEPGNAHEGAVQHGTAP
ncbi:MAG: hypothetical protein M1832_006254 [Thelocarpon impressellum]|nr:MAG: hypothetical protein M1832_006254 [Thelocarpon impressellum]